MQGNVNEIETLIKTQKLSKSALYALLSSIMDYEELANRNMHRAASIIQQFKYISVEEFTENKNTIPLYQLISNNIAQLKDDLAEKQITVNFDVCDQLELHSFEDALGQVIKTLLKNAIQHAFEDSDSGQITVTAEQKNQHIEISVSDQGSGIDESVVEHIFEPFISTKRFEGSMGLGLHIVYNIVNYKLKGQINLDPKVKSGSTFIITLPLTI